jgi:hypothetical protein
MRHLGMIQTEFLKEACKSETRTANTDESRKWYDKLIQNTKLMQEARRLHPDYPNQTKQEADWIVNEFLKNNPDAKPYKQELCTQMLEGLI